MQMAAIGIRRNFNLGQSTLTISGSIMTEPELLAGAGRQFSSPTVRIADEPKRFLNINKLSVVNQL